MRHVKEKERYICRTFLGSGQLYTWAAHLVEGTHSLSYNMYACLYMFSSCNWVCIDIHDGRCLCIWHMCSVRISPSPVWRTRSWHWSRLRMACMGQPVPIAWHSESSLGPTGVRKRLVQSSLLLTLVLLFLHIQVVIDSAMNRAHVAMHSTP